MRGRKQTLRHRYTAEEIRFLERKITGRSFGELAELFNRRFGLSLAVTQIRSACGNRALANGRDCRFKPGQISYNKGMKGLNTGGVTGWFRKGMRPANQKPTGAERVNCDGYTEVRIRNPTGKLHKNWKAKHRIIWEAARGKIPRGHAVIFADGDKRNFALENLILVSRAELAVMNRRGLISANGDLTKAGKTAADIKILIAARKRGGKKRG